MVDVVRGRSPDRELAAFERFNLKGNSRCRPAVGTADCHKTDNHKSQDRHPRIRPRHEAIGTNLWAGGPRDEVG